MDFTCSAPFCWPELLVLECTLWTHVLRKTHVCLRCLKPPDWESAGTPRPGALVSAPVCGSGQHAQVTGDRGVSARLISPSSPAQHVFCSMGSEPTDELDLLRPLPFTSPSLAHYEASTLDSVVHAWNAHLRKRQVQNSMYRITPLNPYLCVYIYIYTCIYACIYTYTHTYICAYIYMRVYIYTRINMNYIYFCIF